MSKVKEERRQKRMQEQRRNALVMVLVAVGIVALVIAIPSLINVFEKSQPVGDFETITPKEHPQAEGRGMGSPDAPVKIEVFEDFQCPACATYTENTESKVIEELIPTGNVYYVFRQFPFLDDRSASKESDQAANASMCAMEQDRFWDYHDMLYQNQSGENRTAFRDSRLLAFAEALGLDKKAFEQCFNENRFKDEIEQDYKDGVALGVTGTPSVFVNGRIINPGYIPSYEDIKAAVDQILNGK